jgi:prevent-host-death family protein
MSSGTIPLSVADYPAIDLIHDGDRSPDVLSFPTLVDSAEKGQRSIIMKRGKPVAAVVPLADLERLRAMDIEARKKMIFRAPEHREMVDFVGPTDAS